MSRKDLISFLLAALVAAAVIVGVVASLVRRAAPRCRPTTPGRPARQGGHRGQSHPSR